MIWFWKSKRPIASSSNNRLPPLEANWLMFSLLPPFRLQHPTLHACSVIEFLSCQNRFNQHHYRFSIFSTSSTPPGITLILSLCHLLRRHHQPQVRVHPRRPKPPTTKSRPKSMYPGEGSAMKDGNEVTLAVASYIADPIGCLALLQQD